MTLHFIPSPDNPEVALRVLAVFESRGRTMLVVDAKHGPLIVDLAQHQQTYGSTLVDVDKIGQTYNNKCTCPRGRCRQPVCPTTAATFFANNLAADRFSPTVAAETVGGERRTAATLPPTSDPSVSASTEVEG